MRRRTRHGKRTTLRDISISAKRSSFLNEGVRAILEAIPKAIYIAAANGRIIFYNKAAAALWGGGPKVGIAGFCGSWKLYTRNGTSLCYDDYPMAKALKEKCPIRGLEAIAERPDGSQIHFLTCPSLIFDADDNLIGAIDMLIDLPDQLIVDEAANRLGAIFDATDDAIIATDLLGIITSWNRGAQCLFGYTAEEAIGKSVTILIPLEQRDEGRRVLMRICKGERIKHYETIRRRKDGSLVEISLAASPIKNQSGRITGTAKIARNITERRQMEEQKNLLIREMDHRIKNLFELSSSIILLSSRTATTTNELASSATARLQALAKAHALTATYSSTKEQPIMLHTLIDTIFAPYADGVGGRESRAMITGTDISVAGTAVTSFALLFHEFVTNAAKYGALSVTGGFVEISCSKDGDLFILEWYERNGPPIEREPESTGFGTHLSRAIMSGQLEGDIFRLWKREGLVMKLTLTSNKIRGQ